MFNHCPKLGGHAEMFCIAAQIFSSVNAVGSACQSLKDCTVRLGCSSRNGKVLDT